MKKTLSLTDAQTVQLERAKREADAAKVAITALGALAAERFNSVVCVILAEKGYPFLESPVDLEFGVDAEGAGQLTLEVVSPAELEPDA